MSEATFTRLLPPNQTDVEGALVQSGATPADTDAGIAAIRTLYDPATMRAAWLPWLAWARDVPLWPRWLTEEVRRALVRDSRNLHRRAGTQGGLAALARYAGGTLLRADTPRTRTYCGPGLTIAEREAFLARYPQLRIYPYCTAGQRQGAMFYKLFLSGRAKDSPLATDAPVRLGAQTYLWDAGSEQPLTSVTEEVETVTNTAEQVRRVAVPGTAGQGTFAGSVPHYLTASDAAKRLYSLREQIAYSVQERTLHAAPISPGLDPISLRWDWGADTGQRRGILLGADYCGSACVGSTAATRLYRRCYLFDPERTLSARGAVLFVGAQRLRFPPFRADLTVRLQGKRCRRQTGRWVTGCLASAPRERYRAMVGALAWSCAARDRVYLNTKTYAPATAGNIHKAGGLVAGAYVSD